MTEHFVSGYCRQLDGSRMVEVIVADGKIDECDCAFGNCQFQMQCTIAKRIEELTAET